jgi:DNA-binding response OmpR family regulator
MTTKDIPTVVLVAEDPFVGSFLRSVLKRHGYGVMTAEARQGLEMLRTGQLNADVVITNTPEIFLPVAQEIHLLYLAAAPDTELAAHFLECRVLRKPFRNEDLLQAVKILAGS